MKKIYIAAAMLVALATGCKKFDAFQIDPNKSTTATPDLLLNTNIQSAFQSTSLGAALATRQMVYTYGSSNEQYYGWARSNFNTYNSLRQTMKMEEAAVRTDKVEYMPLVRFFKAWYFVQLTNTFGDIPFKSALKGEKDTIAPVYDKQEDIFIAVLDDLKIANDEITATTIPVQGDILYSGNMQQWKQLINAFSLRVLMSLSRKENNTKLNVKARFAEIVNNPTKYPLLKGNGDNGRLIFYDVAGTRYPTFNNNDLQTAYYLEETFVNLLKGLQDPRLFSFAEKAPDFVALPDNDFNAYGGGLGSASTSENSQRAVNGELSKIKSRYFNNPVNEASIALGYAEQEFILAEAIVRGWISGSAADHYNNGITASMQFYNVGAAAIQQYQQRNVLSANPLRDIITQKYIASFMNSGWNSFYEQRRTGFPVFDVSGSGVLNNKQIPKRWMYPEAELQTNAANVNAAVISQYSGNDNINGEMWLLKAE
ncbi:SusD/RagB family nutrient-binding outer membrane lipoprotein [Chitinophaga horti]|uniref:SusD/RagB family nutrient-binding outer membrane lipoprotein n=1 Tax=Chitinophaga horti TaxID=2920382 RepID=A0ABY6IXY1_9BACT|nr:SusD/RagB family nutrient-binding outer membrane lipoprotein [Chitinophaga horti]UYQ91001.1 SusD/RagB family nutrient-binding outer membrane lipoprotein [Chitinophaga horti]